MLVDVYSFVKTCLCAASFSTLRARGAFLVTAAIDASGRVGLLQLPSLCHLAPGSCSLLLTKFRFVSVSGAGSG